MEDISFNEIKRSELKIISNTLPNRHFGKWFMDVFSFALRFKPAIDDGVIMIEAMPKFQILDASTKQELYKLETSTTFCFSGRHSKFEIIRCTTFITGVAVDEFNEVLRNTKSTLAAGKTLSKPTLSEIGTWVSDAINSDEYKKHGVKPNWEFTSIGSTPKNQQIIDNLPVPPSCKRFYDSSKEYNPDNKPTTPEGSVISKLLSGNSPNDEDLQILKESIGFYKRCFPMLSEIDLIVASEEQINTLKDYLRFVLSTFIYLSKDVPVTSLFRATRIESQFLDNGKVRNTSFLTHPTIEILKKINCYNRASSPERPLLYVAESENTAIREKRPEKQDRIIISTWFNHSSRSFKAYPLTIAAGILNHEVDQATMAFEEFCKDKHPLIVEWLMLIHTFITNSFVKRSTSSHPKKYEYLYSAYFGDLILQSNPEISHVKDFDCIIYPSVAGEFATNNLALVAETVKNDLSIISATEYEVVETWYDKEFYSDEQPAELRFIRKSKSIIGDRIFWDDDFK